MTGKLAQGVVFGRRHVWLLINTFALVGVPVGVLLASGGFRTIGFWLQALFWLPFAGFALSPAGIAAGVVAGVLGFVAKRTWKRFEYSELPVCWGAIGLFAGNYVTNLPLDKSGVNLPIRWGNLGPLVVIISASCLIYGLLALGERLAPRTPPWRSEPVVPRVVTAVPKDPPPDSELFWSDECVVAWRSWTWDGTYLSGVRVAWESAEIEAVCDSCDEIPGWHDWCGIYAVKDANAVHRFHRDAQVVGTVELWGMVIEAEHGYRASHARITELFVPTESLAGAIQQVYPGVPVHVGRPIDRTRRTDG